MRRDYHRFGLEYLERKGYDVEIWIVRNGMVRKHRLQMSAGMYKGKNMFELFLLEFEQKVRKNKNGVYVFAGCSNAIYVKAMEKYKCKYIIYEGTGNIIIDYSKTKVSKNKVKVIHLFTSWLHQEYKKRVLQSALKNFRKNLPQYVFLGREIKNRWLSYVPSDRKIYIHSFDYDRYMETREKNEINEKYIVYIDSGWGNLDQDKVLTNYYDPWDKNANIWDKLESVFDKLERYYHLPVIVAGHPHTKYTSRSLCNRKIIFNKTSELVANARFVIMQWSTSVSFALLFKKDILALIDNDFKKTDYWRQCCIPNYKYFGITPCNMDIPKMAESPWEYVHKIDEQTAQKYISEYIKKPGTPEKLFAEVVEEKIREIGLNGR